MTIHVDPEIFAPAFTDHFVISYIISNATDEQRVRDVIAIKPLLSTLRNDDWDIARIAVGLNSNFQSDVLRVVANTVESALPAEKTLGDLDRTEIRDLTKILLETQKLMAAQASKVSKFIADSKSMQSMPSEPVAEKAVPAVLEPTV